jgi:hypothetical protein
MSADKRLRAFPSVTAEERRALLDRAYYETCGNACAVLVHLECAARAMRAADIEAQRLNVVPHLVSALYHAIDGATVGLARAIVDGEVK